MPGHDPFAGIERRLTLRDGRILCCAEYGDPAGAPVFYFHGFPGSRLEAAPAAATAADRGVRLVAVDRPGYGGSDFKPGRTLGDFAFDVAEAADLLGLERFAALGVSGGAPYLLSCARALPPRLAAAGIFCGLGPLEGRGDTVGMSAVGRFALGMAHGAPASAHMFAGAAVMILKHWPERAIDHLVRTLPEPDREVLSDERLRPVFAASYREAVRGGPRGPAHDLQLYVHPWDFKLKDVAMPVHLWQGERDTVVPPAMARAMQAALPDCRLRLFPDEGHFSIVVRRFGGMLELLRGGMG